MSEDLDAAADRTVEPDDGPQRTDFPDPGSADDTKDFTPEYFKVEAIVDGFAAEPVDKISHTYDRLVRLIWHGQICMAEKKIENPASSTITRKIASTTDSVVRRPTLLRAAAHLNPS